MHKLIFITIFSFMNSASVFAQDLYSVRAATYGAYGVSNDLHDSLNRPENYDLRVEMGSNSGRQISSSWLHNSNEYMSRVNNRAAIDAVDTLTPNEVTVNLPKKPSKPEVGAFKAGMQALEEQKIQERKAIIKSFNQTNSNLINSVVGDDFLANKKLFADKGLSQLFDDLTELADGGFSNTKITRKIIADINANKAKLVNLSPKLRQLANVGSSTFVKATQVTEKIDREIKSKTQFFESAQSEYPSKLEEYDKEVQRLESESKTAIALKKQEIVDNEFFKKKKLNPIKELSELTPEERILLLNHSGKPLASNDPAKAIDIINNHRASQKNFIIKVRDISNEVSLAATEGRAPRMLTGKIQVQAQALTKSAINKDLPGKYKDNIHSRVTSAKHYNGIDALGVTDPRSKLALADVMSGGSINPGEGFNTRTGLQGKEVKNLLDTIPSNDIMARKALARYILEKGSASQVQSLKFHASPLVFSVEQEEKFKMRCKR